MSLLSYSSPWTNESSNKNDNGVSKKRTPTLGGIPRKTVKVRPDVNDAVSDKYSNYKLSSSTAAEDNEQEERRGSQAPESIDDHIEKQTDRTTKINSILNRITSFSADDKLGDFNPMPYPTTITKKNADQILTADKPVNNGENPLMPKNGKPEFSANPPLLPKPVYYKAAENGSTSSQYANYRDAYGKEGLAMGSGKEPYYSKMGLSGSGGGDKVLDRLNYMTQILESIQMEKTNHVTEEFVLYSLLGVFMIYIVDGFSRGGKYVR